MPVSKLWIPSCNLFMKKPSFRWSGFSITKTKQMVIAYLFSIWSPFRAGFATLRMQRVFNSDLEGADSQGDESNEIKQRLMGQSVTCPETTWGDSLMETICNRIKCRQDRGKQRNNKIIMA